MSRITNTDQIMLQLQAQLQKKKKFEKKQTVRAAAEEKERKSSPIKRFKSMLDSDSIPETEVHRAFVAGLLTEEFGAKMSNDPAFQNVIDRVLNSLVDNPAGKKLLSEAVGQLKSSTKI